MKRKMKIELDFEDIKRALCEYAQVPAGSSVDIHVAERWQDEDGNPPLPGDDEDYRFFTDTYFKVQYIKGATLSTETEDAPGENND